MIQRLKEYWNDAKACPYCTFVFIVMLFGYILIAWETHSSVPPLPMDIDLTLGYFRWFLEGLAVVYLFSKITFKK